MEQGRRFRELKLPEIITPQNKKSYQIGLLGSRKKIKSVFKKVEPPTPGDREWVHLNNIHNIELPMTQERSPRPVVVKSRRKMQIQMPEP